MLWSGVLFDIDCFTPDPAQPDGFCDRFSLFSELAQLSLPPWSFSAEIGIREAFAHPPALSAAVAEFRKLLLVPRLYTTGAHFTHRQTTVERLEQLADQGVQQIVLRVNEPEAAALASDSVRHLVEGCHAGGIDLRLHLELSDSFTEDACRIARTIEDRQFTVTVVPVRLRPTRSLPLADAIPLEPKERVHIIVHATGDVRLQMRTPNDIVELTAGNARNCPLHQLLAPAYARL